ncbi:hypothetical protein RR46_14457 [Papilio xuthus]|uniref:Uncharacterized protein n=1 Tax=Papilio xuthus TaxID=66420 RepID=A0A194PD70_PAPXU|nr:hypothetical protein RR46_14457 [Papilio xuthus]
MPPGRNSTDETRNCFHFTPVFCVVVLFHRASRDNSCEDVKAGSTTLYVSNELLGAYPKMPNTIFIMEKCCFCVKLRVGCLIIAYFQLLIEVVTLGLSLYGIVEGSIMLTSTIKAITDMGFIMMTLSGLFLVAIALMLVFTIVLIIGLHKKKDAYIRAYLLCAMIYLVVAATTSFVSFPLLLVSAIDVAYKILSLILHVYFIFVYYNFELLNRREIQKHEARRRPATDTNQFTRFFIHFLVECRESPNLYPEKQLWGAP